MIEFFMPMAKVPTVTHQQKQVHVVNGKPVFYEPADLKAARSKLNGYLSHNVPEKMIEGPVRFDSEMAIPLTGKHFNGEWKYTKPDTDNLQKLLKDCMTTCRFWKDDALVCSEIVEKFWANQTGIYIRIEEL